jgi:transposase-like protein
VVEKYSQSAHAFPVSRWLEENVPEAFTVFELPAAHRRYLRTCNLLERVHKAVKAVRA